MKTTFEIARTQLARLFYSPIAWLVLIILLIQMGYSFTEQMKEYESFQRKNLPWLTHLTENIFSSFALSRPGVIYMLSRSMYLYLPLLTMGLLSSEQSGGTIKLLWSSPITTKQLVFGKFLSMLIFSLLIIVCLWLAAFGGLVIIKDFDLGLVISASIGLFLLSCAYSSIGLFISSFSPSQIVVAISTFVILALLNFVDKVGQETPILREITFWLSMPSRANDFIKGLIKSHNLIYFLLVSIVFLVLTILKLEFRRKSVKWPVQILFYTLVITVVLLTPYISSKPSLTRYHDMTDAGRNTISQNSRAILSKLTKGPLEMKVFANILDDNVHSALPYNQNVDKRIFEQYQRFKPDMKFEYIYFYDSVENLTGLYEENEGLSLKQLAQKVAKSYNLDFDKVLSPSEIKEIVDLSEEENQYVRQLEYQNRKVFLRMFNGIDHYPGEEQIVGAVKNLLRGNNFNIGFISGHNERSFRSNRDGDYKMALDLRHQYKHSLRNSGINFVELSLLHNEIPDSIDILVIADPGSRLSDTELSKIQSFIDEGRNLFIAIEPDKSFTISPILKSLQVSQLPGELTAENDKELAENLILAQFAKDSTLFPNPWQTALILKYKYPITMPSVSAMNYSDSSNDFSFIPFLTAQNVKSDSLTKEYLQVNTALMLSRKIASGEQRIFISGDADFISNREMTRRNTISFNRKGVAQFIFHWLSNYEYPVDIQKPSGNDNYLYLAGEEGQTITRLKVTYMGIIPGLLLILGASILILRKRN